VANDGDDGAIVGRRTGGSPWRVWGARDLLPADAGPNDFEVPEWSDPTGGSHRACAFFDGDHAWVAGFGRTEGDSLVVFRTENGGQHWTVTRLWHGSLSGAVEPEARMTFRDLRNGLVEFINPAQNRTGGYESKWTFGTKDGGVHWKLLSETVKCGWQTCDY
jgi:hypothetical protein